VRACFPLGSEIRRKLFSSRHEIIVDGIKNGGYLLRVTESNHKKRSHDQLTRKQRTQRMQVRNLRQATQRILAVAVQRSSDERVGCDCQRASKSKAMKTTHGGKRPNAGRKPTGKTAVTRSVSMPPAVWQAIDDARGKHSRGRWISGLHQFWQVRVRKTKG
jgi:hypothetical protein